METKKFSPKDAKLIRENPGRSPEELLSLGLSKAAFVRLAEYVPVILEPIKVEAMPPKVQTGRMPNHVVRLLNKATNVVVELGYRAAKFAKDVYPEKFEILSK